MNACDDQSQFGGQDWSQFDFSKWNLSGLKLGTPSNTFSDLAEKLFASPQWRQHFSATLPAMKDAVQSYFERRSATLQAGLDRQARQLTDRTSQVRKATSAFQERINSAAAPPIVSPDPNSFTLGAKVIEEKTRLGLPGLRLQVMDTRGTPRVLSEVVTDLDGNAVLLIPKEQAGEIANQKAEPTVVVRTPDGTIVHQAPHAICPRPNHAETWIATLPASAQLEPHLSLASEMKNEREALLANLQTKVPDLNSYYERVQQVVKSQLDTTNGIIEAIRKESSGAQGPEPLFSTVPREAGSGDLRNPPPPATSPGDKPSSAQSEERPFRPQW